MACDAPISIRYDPPLPDGRGGYIYYFPADCGKCLKCLMKRKAQWSYRMVEEKRVSFSSCFLTLTYDEKNVPRTDTGFTTYKQDHFDFISELKWLEKPKQLKERNYVSSEEMERILHKAGEFSKVYDQKKQRIKYFAVSEYGDENGRSHWHYILFNVRDFNNFDRAWNRGRVQIDECNVNTIDYVLKYMVKDRSNSNYDEKDRELQFVSKGIGSCVIDSEFSAYVKTDRGNQVINSRGRAIALPRYYRKKIVNDIEASKKNAYINQAIKEQDIKSDREWIRCGSNPDLVRAQAKDTRLHLLKSRQKRIKV